MKKGKVIKSVSLVALSAVMVGGVAMAAAGCGGGGGGSSANDPVITVTMFSSDIDKSTNDMVCENWAKAYNAAHGTNFSVKISNQTDKAEYFKALGDSFKDGTVGDVMYLAPRNVKTFAKSGRVIDLTEFINEDTAATENINDVWANSLAYYGFDPDKPAYLTNPDHYTMGQAIEYKADGAEGAGFYTTEGSEKVGLYGLPKDYSNFSMGFNRRFFSTELKTAYTTLKATETRSVPGPTGATGAPTENLTYTGSSGTGMITYAASGSYTNPVTKQTVEITQDQIGKDAFIINIGVPVNIKPYNFYMYNSYNTALAAGDPMAVMVNTFTGGKGYTVTIPGFPDETFDMPSDVTVDEEASYDQTQGHIVYTYAEYGALLYSLTYYLNTFAWDGAKEKGGVVDSNGDYRTVYGGEQYEGGAQDGSQMYLLPWLFSNDADLINLANTFCSSYKDTGNMSEAEADAARNTLLDAINQVNLTSREQWVDYAGTATDKVQKLRLDGEYDDVDVQYGLNSKNFIETYAAFLAIGSDWNGNPGDTQQKDRGGDNGWSYFREGRGIFYGAGSWDPATRNEEDREKMDFGQMPTPVAEKYALYSNIKGANYEMVTYSNGAGKSETGTPGKQVTGTVSSTNYKNSDFDADLKIYSKEEIEKNLAYRQDKWGARMDSVGYAVSCKSTDTGAAGGQPTAKTAAAASLCIALTASADSQRWLTYGGAQLPNFVSQCEDLLHFQDEGYENGTFKDMITPEGSATVTGEAGAALWDEYYAIAKEMGSAAYNGDGRTVAEYLAGKTLKDGSPVKYDEAFADTKLTRTEFAGATNTTTARYSFAMKVLRMVAYRAKDFDILIRMQTGLNAVRDSSMYTYDDTWLNPHDARNKDDQMLAYYRSRPLKDDNSIINLADNANLKWNPKDKYESSQFLTPLVFCLLQANEAQDNLRTGIVQEIQDLSSSGIKA